MMIWLAVALTLASVHAQEGNQERPPVPDDSVELVVTGCLTGRALRASDVKQVDVQRGPDVRSRSFRLEGKRDVMDEVKREDGHLVEVNGLVKRSALDDKGIKVGRRVEIAGGSPVSRTGGKLPSPADSVVVLDVWSVRFKASSCGG